MLTVRPDHVGQEGALLLRDALQRQQVSEMQGLAHHIEWALSSEAVRARQRGKDAQLCSLGCPGVGQVL